MTTYSIQPISDDGVLIQFTDEHEDLLPYIHTLTHYLLDQQIAGIKDIVPAFTSIAIFYHPFQLRYHQLVEKLHPLLNHQELNMNRTPNSLEVPVCYDTKLGLDLEEVAQKHRVSTNELITLHSQATYTVAIMGFLPGFPYITGLPEKIWTARKSTPRTHVPKGAVGIGGSYTGIYSLPSPGGWNIIGQTPLTLFDQKKSNPFFFQPGDKVKFIPITLKEFDRLSTGG